MLKRVLKFKEIFENIVVVDDGSPYVPQYFLNLVKREKIIFLRNKINKGRAFSRNLGANKVKLSDYILFIDDDILLFEKSFEYLFNLKDDVVLGRIKSFPLLRRDSSSIYEERKCNKLKSKNKVTFLYSSFLIIKRKLFEKIHGFDESFKFYGGEDTELGIRLRKAGYTINFYPQLEAYHLSVPSMKERLEKLRIYAENSLKKIKYKHPDYFYNLHFFWIYKDKLTLVEKIKSFLLRNLLSDPFCKFFDFFSKYNNFFSYYAYLFLRLSSIHKNFKF